MGVTTVLLPGKREGERESQRIDRGKGSADSLLSIESGIKILNSRTLCIERISRLSRLSSFPSAGGRQEQVRVFASGEQAKVLRVTQSPLELSWASAKSRSNWFLSFPSHFCPIRFNTVIMYITMHMMSDDARKYSGALALYNIFVIPRT